MKSPSRAILNFAVPLEVVRFNPTTRVKGRAQAKTESGRFTIMASIQPMSAREQQLLPEGQRVENTKKIYTLTELRTARQADGTEPDHVIYNGHTYEVRSVEDWVDLGGYWKVIAERIER